MHWRVLSPLLHRRTRAGSVPDPLCLLLNKTLTSLACLTRVGLTSTMTPATPVADDVNTALLVNSAESLGRRLELSLRDSNPSSTRSCHLPGLRSPLRAINSQQGYSIPSSLLPDLRPPGRETVPSLELQSTPLDRAGALLLRRCWML